MHEFALAQGILEDAVEQAESHGAGRITKIEIGVGQLSMVSIEQLRFALDSLKEDTMANDAEIVIEEMPVEISCEKGHGSKVKLDEPLFLSLQKIICPSCGEKAEVTGGRQCYIKNITIEEERECM